MRPTEQRVKPQRRWPRRLLLSVTAVAVGVLIGGVAYDTSLEPGAAIVKAAFEAKPEVTPPKGFAAIQAQVTESKHLVIPVEHAPEARLRIYTPRITHTAALPVILWVHGGGYISS